MKLKIRIVTDDDSRMWKVIACCIVMLCIWIPVRAQYTYGTTGLLHAPTAEMQRDKTVMLGCSYINENVTPGKWRFNTYTYDTFNYYLNVTIFPWLEVGYNLVLNKGIPNSSYWPPKTWRKFSNQDRSFHARLRLWKEGWWKSWTPQIVFGANDPATHNSYGGGSISVNADGEDGTNNYMTRWYVAATKHFEFVDIGTLGVHVAYNWGRARVEPEYNRPSLGLDFQFGMADDEFFVTKMLNGLDLMVEMCPKPQSKMKTKQIVNMGLTYHLWKDYINLIGELYGCKDFSGGVQFKVHLK